MKASRQKQDPEEAQHKNHKISVLIPRSYLSHTMTDNDTPDAQGGDVAVPSDIGDNPVDLMRQK